MPADHDHVDPLGQAILSLTQFLATGTQLVLIHISPGHAVPSCRVKSSQVRSSQVESDDVKSSQVRSSQVTYKARGGGRGGWGGGGH